MKFYDPAAETQGRGIIWWKPRSEWVEIPASACADTTEITLAEWHKRFKKDWGVTLHDVEDACTHFAFMEAIALAAEKRGP